MNEKKINTISPQPHRGCIIVNQQYPEPTVGGLIISPKGRMFLMKSHKWEGYYVIPGGHIELGETMEQALKREIKEETGLTISDIKLICIQEFIFGKTYHKPKSHYIFFDFLCKSNTEKVRLNEEGHSPVWVTPRETLALPLEPFTRKAVLEFLKKNQNK